VVGCEIEASGLVAVLKVRCQETRFARCPMLIMPIWMLAFSASEAI
jgi:hypothetical protein